MVASKDRQYNGSKYPVWDSVQYIMIQAHGNYKWMSMIRHVYRFRPHLQSMYLSVIIVRTQQILASLGFMLRLEEVGRHNVLFVWAAGTYQPSPTIEKHRVSILKSTYD